MSIPLESNIFQFHHFLAQIFGNDLFASTLISEKELVMSTHPSSFVGSKNWIYPHQPTRAHQRCPHTSFDLSNLTTCEDILAPEEEQSLEKKSDGSSSRETVNYPPREKRFFALGFPLFPSLLVYLPLIRLFLIKRRYILQIHLQIHVSAFFWKSAPY